MHPHAGIIPIGQPQAHARVVNESKFRSSFRTTTRHRCSRIVWSVSSGSAGSSPSLARCCSSRKEAAKVAPNAWRGKP